MRVMMLGLAGMVMLTGCSKGVQGEWMSEGVTPAMARDQFKFLRPADFEGEFVKATLELRKDKKYKAEVYYAGELGYSSGTWMYDADRINFLDDQFGAHAYEAELTNGGKNLKIIKEIKGTNVKLHMRRVK
jgi:hypothetical protein